MTNIQIASEVLHTKVAADTFQVAIDSVLFVIFIIAFGVFILQPIARKINQRNVKAVEPTERVG
jgi:Kef-type K+ transport system membrane component KefB